MPHPINGPIPGSNYTSDTKNYPWHRPPEITDLDKGVELSAKQLMSDEGLPGLVTMLKSGIDIASLTRTFCISGIGAGKWTPDFALILAGPVSHIIYLIAKGYDIEAELGIDLPKDIYTHSIIKHYVDQEQNTQTVMDSMSDPAVIAHVEKTIHGIMGAALQTQSQPVPQSQGQPPVQPQPPVKGSIA